jgi:threonine/homoserine/homoserine lactone efflux protein
MGGIEIFYPENSAGNGECRGKWRYRMKDLELLLRGILVGLAISAPVGPVNVLCISRTISKGWAAGVISGLGAAIADTIYGAIASFSIHFVISFLIREEFWIRLFGGILLIAIGVVYYFKKPQSIRQTGARRAKSDIVSTFLLTLTNPTTVLSFLAVLAALHLSGRREWWQTLSLVGGIFLGAMLWWIILATMARHFRDRFNDRAMLWMNRIAGLAIGGFGVLTVILSRLHPK